MGERESERARERENEPPKDMRVGEGIGEPIPDVLAPRTRFST